MIKKVTSEKKGTLQAKQRKTAATKRAKGTPGIKVARFDLKGTQLEDAALPKEIFGQMVHLKLIAHMARVYQMNTRQGTQSTKTRGEVVGSTRKIYRQKGTGRARHGSIKAPIFVGGGIVFGPKPREFNLTLPQKMKQKALIGLLSQRVKDKKLNVLSGLREASGKTKEFATLLERLELLHKNVLVVVNHTMPKAILGIKNLASVSVKPISTLSPFDILQHEYILMAQEAIDQLKSRVHNERRL